MRAILILSGSVPNAFVRTTFLDAGAITLAEVTRSDGLSGTIIVGDGKGGNNSNVLALGTSKQIPNAASVIVRESGLFDLAGNIETLGGLNAVSLPGRRGCKTGTAPRAAGLNGAICVGGSADTSRISGNIDLGGLTRIFNFAATPPLSLQSSRNISAFAGAAVTFTIVASANPGVSVPGGSVQFFDNGFLLDTRQLVGGTASTTTSTLTPGTHVITADSSATELPAGRGSPWPRTGRWSTRPPRRSSART